MSFFKILPYIVNTIGSIDDLIALKTKTIAKIEEEIMFFFQTTSTSPEYAKLGHLFAISIGRTPPTKEREWFSAHNDDVKWLSIKDMANGDWFINETSQHLISEAIHKFHIPIVEKGDILLSFKLTIGKVAIANAPMVTNEAIACFKGSPTYRCYLYCFLKSIDYESTVESTSSIGRAFNSTIIKNMLFPKLSDSELRNFNDKVEPFFNLLSSEIEQINKLKKQKNLLLKKYF